MIWDLNVPWPKNGCVSKLISTAIANGYDGIAFNQTISGKATEKCSMKKAEITAEDREVWQANALRMHRHQEPFQQKFRLTVVLDSASQVHSLSTANSSLQSYDLVAVRPMNEKLFYQCCQSLEIDMITFDMSERLPFMLKFPAVNAAVSRGIFFEICYAPMISEPMSRHYFIANCLNLVRFTKGRNLIFSSQASSELLMRSPYDAINLCTLFGVNATEGKAAISSHCRSALLHAELGSITLNERVRFVPATRRSAQGASMAEPISSLTDLEQWKLPIEDDDDDEMQA